MSDLYELMLEELNSDIKELGLTLDEDQLNKVIAFIKLLIKWNKTYNLTAIIDLKKIITHHILDSLSIIPYLTGPRIIDIGSGAGFPGIPCAIALPEHDFILLDSNGKKTRFLTQVVAQVEILNVEIVQSRVEHYEPSHKFNTITARAFSDIDTIYKLSHHLLEEGGELLCMKGVYPEEELHNLGKLSKVHKLSIPGLEEERHVVCIKGSK